MIQDFLRHVYAVILNGHVLGSSSLSTCFCEYWRRVGMFDLGDANNTWVSNQINDVWEILTLYLNSFLLVQQDNLHNHMCFLGSTFFINYWETKESKSTELGPYLCVYSTGHRNLYLSIWRHWKDQIPTHTEEKKPSWKTNWRQESPRSISS